MGKIVVIVRTLDEEVAVGRFCQCYEWADEIIIADGGSKDKTKDIASKFDNVRLYEFTEKIWHNDTVFSNPRGKHINFLIERAKKHDAEWIIFDDCDCVPTKALQNSCPDLIHNQGADLIFAYRMYIFGQDKWFPKMSFMQSLWAWKASVPVIADESSHTISLNIPKGPSNYLDVPMTLLHYFYPNEETLQKKKSQYLLTGEVSEDYNPVVQFAPLDNLPEWATWK